jgi:hypothetical protein
METENEIHVRPSGISYLLANGKQGNITDPWALRAFYYRISQRRHYEEKQHDARWTSAKRRSES